MNWSRLVGTAVLLACASASAARAEECYYMLIFASQKPNMVAAPSHTFGTFVKAAREDGCAGPIAIEVHTISWLPEKREGRHVARLLPEPGVNLDLDATLKYVLGEGQRVSLWGPYQ